MDLAPYVDKLCRELAVTAEAGGAEARALAERLIGPLESATRLALLEALSAAADEISRELAPGSVDVRLRGVDPDFLVTPAPTTRSFEAAAGSGFEAGPGDRSGPPPTAAPVPEADEGGMSRITLRLSEQLKPRVEQAASRAGLSVNAWLVRTVTAALEPEDRDSGRRATSRGTQRYTGWVR
ncbi:hypothetical protein [Embleya scabrispora]|uniref:hypothetical protein n=1 Tax=Embleya scabrispora TaxID=159449 RepID=UPI00036DD665|nr:hypothetical protein [Embleya scabrispora]MYS83044.1 hypothetical protein [Streptomyces sp. SID5474]